MAPGSSASRSARPADSVTVTRRRLSARAWNGELPGNMVVMNHSSEPATWPRRTRGRTPARTKLDFPVPEPPTTNTNRPSRPP